MNQKLLLFKERNTQATIKNNVVVVNGIEYTFENLREIDEQESKSSG